MRKGTYLLLAWIASLVIFVVLSSVLPLFHHSLFDLAVWTSTEELLFTLFALLVVLTVFFVALVETVRLASTRLLRAKLEAILKNKSFRSDIEPDQLVLALSEKMRTLTRKVQLIDNQDTVKKEEIVEGERKRIARDLHDTVSQELFATSMILSGLSSNLTSIPQETVQEQLFIVKGMIESAQRDLRILLLHLRPSELEGKTLVEGFDLILREVSDKSTIQVHFKHDVKVLPKQIEEHLFRIAQEVISNTLRHAQATHLDIYLIQKETELQLKMSDDGVGMSIAANGELSYGLQNIRDRVEDMAGTLRIRTSPNKGVAIDIRIPLLKGEEQEHESYSSDVG